MVHDRFRSRAPAIALILTSAWSCRAPTQEHQHATAQRFQEVRTQLDRLYTRYLNGDREEAKRSMQEAVAMIQSSKLGAEFERFESASLFLAYARLYVLEKRAGNGELAEADVVKARYWYLRKDELSGKSVEEASAAVAEFTPERCMAFVDEWDRGCTDGLGPKYARDGRAPDRQGATGTTMPSTRPAATDPRAAQERGAIGNERSNAAGPSNEGGDTVTRRGSGTIGDP